MRIVEALTPEGLVFRRVRPDSEDAWRLHRDGTWAHCPTHKGTWVTAHSVPEEVLERAKTAKTAAANDALRRSIPIGTPGNRIVMTSAVAADPNLEKILHAVRVFDAFTEDNNPHKERDFAIFEVEGERYFFKVDPYDKNLEYGSEDPSDPEKTTMVLTIGGVGDL